MYVHFSETPIRFGKSSNLNNLALPHPYEKNYKFIFAYTITQVHFLLGIPSTPHKIKVSLKANKRFQRSPKLKFYTTWRKVVPSLGGGNRRNPVRSLLTP